VLLKFPVLISVAAEPVAAVVVPLVREAHGNAVLAESPDFLDQAVVELALATCASGTLRSPHGRGGIARGCASGCRAYRRARRAADRACSKDGRGGRFSAMEVSDQRGSIAINGCRHLARGPLFCVGLRRPRQLAPHAPRCFRAHGCRPGREQ
jgi:hypothetical protein